MPAAATKMSISRRSILAGGSDGAGGIGAGACGGGSGNLRMFLQHAADEIDYPYSHCLLFSVCVLGAVGVLEHIYMPPTAISSNRCQDETDSSSAVLPAFIGIWVRHVD